MVKRYYGGLITSRKIVANATIASGIYNKNIHIQAVKAAAWPDTTIKIPVYVTDPFFSYNSLLINADTTATPFNADASTNKFNISVLADAKATNFNPYTPGYYSAYFDGTGDYLSIPSSSNLAFDTGDFCVEMWYYQPTIAFAALISNSVQNGSAPLYGDAQFEIQISASTYYPTVYGWSTAFLTSSVASTAGRWNHIAVCRNGTTASMFLNGVRVATATVTNNFSSTNSFNIGRQATNSGYLIGYISNLRISKGSSIYDPTSSSITIPTSPLTAVSGTQLLICQSNRFIDNSTNNFTITVNADTKVTVANPFSPVSSYSTYGSGYFDGTGDYLSVPYNSAFNVAGGTFTIEAWINITGSFATDSGGNKQGAIAVFGPATVGQGWEFFIDQTSNILYFSVMGSNSNYMRCSYTFSLNTWYHVAVVRNGSSNYLFVNGASQTLTIDAYTGGSAASSTLNIGAAAKFSGYEHYFIGYISNFRIVNDTALYTSNFTPSTTPLTAVSGTSLLTLQNNQPHNNSTFLDRSNFKSLVTRYGNATQGTFTPYGANWSNYFDGTGDYLSIASAPAIQLNNTTAFTIEFWVNPFVIPAVGSSAFIFRGYNELNPYSGYGIGIGANTTNNQLQWWDGTAWHNIGILSANIWTHVAISYEGSGTTRRFFINGVLQGSAGTIPSTINYTSGTYTIGTRSADFFLTGYISNFRIVKGTALYTAAFTPPTEPLTAVSGTSLLTCQSNRFIDTSTNNFTITKNGDVSVQRFSPFAPSATNNYYTPETYGGSIYLDGSGDYVSIANSDSHNCLTGDFTIEAWVYPLSVTGMIFGSDNGASSDYFYMTPTELAFAISATSSPNYPSWSYAFKTNQWYHIAFVRASNTLYAYVNGVRLTLAGGSASESRQFFISGVPVLIGRYGYASNPIYLNGYISDVRLVKGTAVYAGNFTPPIAPLLVNGSAASYTSTANVNTTFSVANTMALLNFTDAAIKDLSMSGVMETLGDSKITTANSKFGGSAMYFDGTGDYLSFPSNPLYAIGATEDYTIECWVNFSTVQTCAFWQTTNNISSANGPFWFGYESGALKSSQHGSGTYAVSYTWSPTAGTWYHVAATRASGTVRLFVNGVVVTTNASTQSGIGFTQSGAAVGVLTTPAYLVGYLDDLRFTKGNARYTGNFTPATSTFPLR